MKSELLEDRLSGRGTQRAVIWPWRLTIFSFTMLTIALAVFVGLRFGYGNFVRNEIVVTDEEIANLAASISTEDQDRFLSFYRQLVALKNVMDNHVAASKVFDWLERQTHEQVFFENLEFNPSDRILKLSAIADSYAVVIEQLEALERLSEVESYKTSRIEKKLGRTSFDITIKLKPVIYIF